MTPQLILALLLVASVGATCTQADEIECLSSLCPNYYYLNSTCYLNSSSSCTTAGYVYHSGSCVNCLTLGSTNCSVICPDFLYRSAGGSAPSTCTSCQTLYGTSCIRCTSSACLICAYSSNLALASDRSGCINSNCSVTNCLICYTDGSRCYKCKAGFIVNANFTCSSTSCSVANCITCSGTLCANCFPGYQISTDHSACHPICSDSNCNDCIAPNICGTCATYYTPVNGICTIDCTAISIANCKTCNSPSTCTQCNPGYSLSNGGTVCSPTCLVSNCNKCLSNDTSTCQDCMTGWDLSTDGKTCTVGICQVEYCQTCASMSTCGTCISGFTLSSDNTSCTSNCLSTFSNCLFCSSTACTSCENGYFIGTASPNVGKCVLICAAITNCVRCYSPTQCASCADGYFRSDDMKTCSRSCKVPGCLTCADSTTFTCQTCKTGYSPDTSGATTICKKNCRDGMVNTASSGVTCEKCKDKVSYCNTCDVVNSNVVCTSCQEGYFVNGNECDKCDTAITNCLKCTDSRTCTHCKNGYKNIDGACSNTNCAASVTNCYSCKPTTTSVCFRCNPGYFFNSSNLCQQKTCSAGFIFQESTQTCVCPNGAYELNAACYPCADSHCSSCTVSACSTCRDGYYPVGTTCQACLAHCESCTSASNCLKCARSYSVNSQGVCVPFGNGRTCAVSLTGLVFRCDPGCRVCVIGVTASVRVVCLVPHNGYSIVGGEIVRCDPSCRECSSYVPTLCTSCYSRSVLIAGSCQSCTDANALSCSSYNPTFSTSCKLGYTAAYSSGGTPGTCTACAQFCERCDTAGPGNCDKGQCKRGSVQLLGTTNCSMCFNGCVRCSNADPNTCLDCGYRRYSNNGECTKCPTGCYTCTSATSCQSCEVGYWLVGTACNVLPNFCTGLSSSTGLCTGCLQAYKLTADSTGCQADLSCNTTGTCQACPDGYYLFSSRCQTCSVGANCIACQTTNNTLCLECSAGYYLDASYSCVTCTTNCATCDSAVFCTKASTGYFIRLDDAGGYSGETAQCLTPCATCADAEDFCLTCLTGYSLYGSTCRRNMYLILVIVLGQSRSGISIFSDTDSADKQQYLGIRAFNRLGNAISLILPSKFNDGRHWRRRMRFRSFKKGSVVVDMNLEAGSYSDASQASSDLTNSLVTSSIDGARYVSSSVTAEGFSSTTGSSTSLGLVLGLSIPLSILLILIIVLVVYSYRKETETGGETKGDGFYSEDVLEKAEDL